MVRWIYAVAGTAFLLFAVARLVTPAQISPMRGGIDYERSGGGDWKVIRRGSIAQVLFLVAMGLALIVYAII